MNPVTAAVQNGMGPVDSLPGRRQGATAAKSTQSPPSPSGDVVSLSQPPEGDPKTIEVVVDAWGKGKNSSLSGILLNQGYPREALTERDSDGHSLLERVAAQNGLRNPDLIHPGQTIVAVSHADPIKAALAAAVGTHLDLFQRIVVSPCSVSAVLYGGGGPVVLATNSTGRDLTTLRPS